MAFTIKTNTPPNFRVVFVRLVRSRGLDLSINPILDADGQTIFVDPSDSSDIILQVLVASVLRRIDSSASVFYWEKAIENKMRSFDN